MQNIAFQQKVEKQSFPRKIRPKIMRRENP
jgi:hypothetical protein